MKRISLFTIVAVLILALLLSSGISEADDSFTSARGMNWGMSPEEVMAIEEELGIEHEDLRYYSYSEYFENCPLDLAQLEIREKLAFSKFKSANFYFFLDNELVIITNELRDNFYDPVDLTYLQRAFSTKYGDMETLGIEDFDVFLGEQCLDLPGIAEKITDAYGWHICSDADVYLLVRASEEYGYDGYVFYVNKDFGDRYISVYDTTGL